MHIGHLDGAIDSLRRLLGIDPEIGEAHALLAVCLLQKRRLDAAWHEAGIALALEPEAPMARYAAAEVLIAKRRFADAEEQLHVLLAIAPEVPAYHRSLARLYDLTGRRAERRATLDKALDLDPEDAGTLADLADCSLDANDLEGAGRYALEALHSAPESSAAQVALGRVALRAGRVAEAREHALQALRGAPDDPGALHLLTAVKMRGSPFLGLWWRYNTWMSGIGAARSVLVLLGAFLLYRIATIASQDAGNAGLAIGIQVAWLGVVIYTFVGPGLFRKALRRELESVSLNRNF
jgi:tetratricopeptide (TPR) repeat protein